MIFFHQVIRQQTYLVLLRLNKFLLLTVAHSLLYMVVDAQSPDSTYKVCHQVACTFS